MIDRVESPLQIKGKYFPFPETPKEILIQGISAHEYIGGTELRRVIDEFSRQVNLNWYDALCVAEPCAGINSLFIFMYSPFSVSAR